MMRVPLIAGNWKMNTTVAEAVRLVREMLPALDPIRGVEKLVCPPFVSLAPVADIIRGSSIQLGAQNMHHMDRGAYTGEVSPLMLTGLCQYVIIGHSERRQFFGDTSEVVNRKLGAALQHGLRPILCVGENLRENDVGITEAVVATQLRTALKGLGATSAMVVAYEPLWAIGTGKAASGEQAARTIEIIRAILGQLWGGDSATSVRMLYGGSVTGANITEFVSQPGIDGALVGGASLKAADFVSIASQTAAIKKRT